MQTAHVLAVFEVQVIVETVPVDVRSHPGAGILGGAQAQAVEAEREVIVAFPFAVFAARVQFTEHQVPVPALLCFVVIHRDAAAEVFDLHAVVRVQGHIDVIAVTVPGFVDGVGDNLKDGMGAPIHPVRAKNNRRALAHPVGPLQCLDTFVAISLLFCHSAFPSWVLSNKILCILRI